ncbi:MAG: hypothetical protein M3P82_03655, partial [Bacteroidota bacterium]|nr:hypothetical protein [Bacteroidota bacterium]
IFLYSFSPLIIFEFFINAHIDILILFFLSGFIFFALRENAGSAFLFLSLSVLSKIYSIIFLPLYLIYFLNSGYKAKKIITAVFFFMLPFVILIFYGNNIANIFITMQNYLQHWYFNNLIYVLINYLLNFFEVDNHLYARLILIIIFMISYGLILKSRFTFLQKICFVSISYLLFSHTVHPWYLTLPVLLLPLCFTSSSIFWSGFIVFTNLTVYFYLKDKIWEDILLVLVPEFCILVILIIADIKRITSSNETKKFR